jgi:hypothetical protein
MDQGMKIRVVHLASRPDRGIFFPEEMQRMFFDYSVFFAVNPPGMDDPLMASSCTHVDALRGISGELLVCEDDVCFLKQGRELFNKAYDQLPEDWDMLYLGGNIHEPAEPFSENLYRIHKGVHCNHAILYSEKARSTILSTYDLWTNDIKAYDHWLYMVGQGIMNCFIMSPIIAYQRPGYSCNGKWQDYYIDMRSNEIKYLC